MQAVFNYILEQIKYFPVIYRMTKYDQKNNYQNYALGLLWQYLSPLTQIFFYYLMFGLLFNRSGIGENKIPYLPWLIIGMAVWNFSNGATRSGLRSIIGNFNLASRVSIPKNIFPTISVLSHVSELFVLLSLGLIVSVKNGYSPSIYWFGFIYSFFATFMFCVALAYFNSVVAILYRDYIQIYISIMRIGMFISGAMFDLQSRAMPEVLRRLIMLNPFYYLTETWRLNVFTHKWFWQTNLNYLVFFWLLVLILLIIASNLYNKYQESFGDYL